MGKSHFDLDSTPEEPLQAEEISDNTPIVSKPKGPKLIALPLGLKLTPVQAGIAGMSLVAIILFALMRNSAPEGNGAPPQFASQDTVASPAPTVAVQPVVVTPQQQPASLSVPSGESTAAMSAAEQDAIENLRVYGENNRQGLTALDQRLRAVERQLSLLAQPKTAEPAPLPTKAAAAKPAATSHYKTTRASGLKGATISSLYPDLAWVMYQGSTWAVRPGDRLGNASVERIDMEKREVITTAGIIR
jgi:intracellular multiplication protein IcmG